MMTPSSVRNWYQWYHFGTIEIVIEQIDVPVKNPVSICMSLMLAR